MPTSPCDQPSSTLCSPTQPHFPPALSLSDPWKTLGVGHSASEEEIKRAHRRLVRQHHPDLHAPGDEAVAARFISIQQAYEIVMGRALGRLPESSQHGGWNFHDWWALGYVKEAPMRARLVGGWPVTMLKGTQRSLIPV